MKYRVVVIGGGIAGLSAARELEARGVFPVLIVERESYLGGILKQCIHHGFGLKHFKSNLTGPEYAMPFIDYVSRSGKIDVMLDTDVLEIEKDKKIVAVNESGLYEIETDVLVMATGCIERHIGQISVNGNRPYGVFTAGSAQRIVNVKGGSVGKKILILGSGDVGMIMARRLTLEGKKVVAVIERSKEVSGLRRNKIQCLDDYGIPLKTSHTVSSIFGKKRLEAVGISPVDDSGNPIVEMETVYECDGLITSIGLIPDAELCEQLDCEDKSWIFKLGNCHYIHDIADSITIESGRLAESVKSYLVSGTAEEIKLESRSRSADGKEDYDFLCTVCPKGCGLRAEKSESEVAVFGHCCPRGKEYALSELEEPMRDLTTTLEIGGGTLKRAVVKTSRPIPKNCIFDVIKEIKKIKLEKDPKSNDVLISDVLGTGADIMVVN